MRRALAAGIVLAALTASQLAHAGGPTMWVGAAEDSSKASTLPAARAKMDLARLAGLDTIRLTSIWSPGQTAPPSDDLARLHNAVDAANLVGIRPIVAIYSENGTTAPVTPAARAEFADYAASVANSLPTVNDVIVGNEPNNNRFWLPQFNPDGTSASPSAYLALLAETYDALKAVRAGITVLGGALSPHGGDVAGAAKPTHSPTRFLQQLGAAYRASGRTLPVMDVFALHGYQDYSDIPPSFLHPNSTTIALPDYGKLVALLGNAFDGTPQPGSTLPIVYTEFGIEADVPPAHAGAYTGTEPTTRRVSAETQGAYYEEALKIAHCQPNVRGLLFFLVSDEPRLEGWQSGVHYANDAPKASLAVVRDAAGRSRGGTLTTCPDTTPPTVELTAPKAIGGTVTLSATASDDVGVGKVEFLVDEHVVASKAVRPYSVQWTPTAADGPVTITARAIDAAGNAGTDAESATVGDIVYAAGDIASCDSDGDEATAALLDARPDGTVVVLGDAVYDNGTAAEFVDCYEPTWGRHKARTRPAIGNHEYGTDGGGPYWDYFGAAAGERGKGWYSFDVGSWHVVVLNSNCDVVGCGVGSEQEEWLRADLAAHPASCTLAAAHHPRVSSGAEHGNQPQMQPLYQALYETGVDLFLAGHDHHYERFARLTPWGTLDGVHGVRQFIVGTGGKSLRAFGVVRLGSEVRDNSADGILQLTLHATGYAWEFVPEAGGTFADSGSDECSTAAPAPWTQPFLEAVKEDAPIAHLRLGDDAGSTAADSTGNGHNGAATAVEFGVVGALVKDPDRAAHFEAGPGSGVVVPDAPELDPGTGDFTIEAWVRTTTNGEQVIAAKGGPAGGWRLTVTDDPGSLAGRARFRLDETGPVYGPMLRIDDGKWHHVVAAVERSWGVHLYVDGAEGGGGALVPGALANEASLSVGAAVSGAPAFDGDLDEVAYYNELLPAGRVRAHHLGGRSGDAPVDNLPPETTILSGPSGSIVDGLATFSFRADEAGAVFECRLDTPNWEDCESPKSYAGLTEGTHEFQLRARDTAGNVDASPEIRNWEVQRFSGGWVGNGSFERSLQGWRGVTASLQQVEGSAGAKAARAARTGPGSFGVVSSSFAVTNVAAGAAYTAGTRVRSDLPGDLVCLGIREWSTTTTIVNSSRSCARTTTQWQELPAITHRVGVDGAMLDLLIWQVGGGATASFDVDAISLTGPFDPGLVANGSFETSTAGWRSWNAQLTTAPGSIGNQSTRATRNGASSYGVLTDPHPMANAAAGARYTASARLRSESAGGQVCLALREWNPARTAILATTKTCLTLTGDWQQLPTAAHTVAAPGSSLDLLIWQSNAPISASFDVDAVSVHGPYDSGLLTNGSFEGSFSGWRGWSGTLAMVPGRIGADAARATRDSSTSYGLLTSTHPVANAAAGARYTASARLRSESAGGQVCLALREWNPARTAILATTKTCLTLTGDWQQLPTAAHTVAAPGSSLDLLIWQSNAPTSASFDVDAVSLRAAA